MESLKITLVLLAFVAYVAVGDVGTHTHHNCHHYTPATKPASEHRIACPPGHDHSGHGHTHHGHPLPPGHTYGQPTGTASIIMQFQEELNHHKDMVVQDLMAIAKPQREGKFLELITSLREKKAPPTWLNAHCTEYINKLNDVHKMQFRMVLEEKVVVRNLP